MRQWGQDLMFQKTHTIPSVSLCLFHVIRDASSQLVLSPNLCTTIMHSDSGKLEL